MPDGHAADPARAAPPRRAPLAVVIADDEPPARHGLRVMLARHPDARVVGEARSGAEAVALLRERRPDVLFLDVRMPDGDGFEVVRAAAHALGADAMPAVVFATAYDHYAVRAFEANALDYLLKPYERERFDAAWARVRSRLAGGVRDAEQRLLALVDRVEAHDRYLRRVAVRAGARVRLLDVGGVEYFEAESNYVRVHTADGSEVVRTTLAALEAQLDPASFARVHRSLVVNLRRVREVEPMFAGEYVLFLASGRRLTTGRTFRARVQAALGLRP